MITTFIGGLISKTVTKTESTSPCTKVYIASSPCPLVYKIPLTHSKVLWTWPSQASKWQFAYIYLDKTVIISKTLEQHIVRVCKVFLLLFNSKATLKHKNWNIFTNTIDYLRHLICTRGLSLHHVQRMLSMDSSPNKSHQTEVLA